jgi:biotin operon repressor
LFEVIELIPEGYKNAVSRTYLSELTNKSDRAVRADIEELRNSIVVLSNEDGTGYYLPTPEDDSRALQVLLRERARRDSIDRHIKVLEKYLRGRM